MELTAKMGYGFIFRNNGYYYNNGFYPQGDNMKDIKKICITVDEWNNKGGGLWINNNGIY